MYNFKSESSEINRQDKHNGTLCKKHINGKPFSSIIDLKNAVNKKHEFTQ